MSEASGGAPQSRRPFPVRWWACGYRDGFTGVHRGPVYFNACHPGERESYAQGYREGERQARQQERHKQLIALSKLEPTC